MIDLAAVLSMIAAPRQRGHAAAAAASARVRCAAARLPAGLTDTVYFEHWMAEEPARIDIICRVSREHRALLSSSGQRRWLPAVALQRAYCDVEVFAPLRAFAATLPRRYVLRAAVSGAEFELDAAPQLAGVSDRIPRDGRPALEPYLTLLQSRPRPAIAALQSTGVCAGDAATETVSSPAMSGARHRAAQDLAHELRARGFDTIWSQWPVMPSALTDLFRCAPYHGLTTVHTVHNVFPHEANPAEAQRLQVLYRDADALVVHSAQAAAMLAGLLPHKRAPIVESRHGTYSIYPRRPEQRAPVRALLGVARHELLLLCFGAIRPYKNTDALIEALALVRDLHVTLVIAGWEYGFTEHVPGDKLGRTRARIAAAGMTERVRLLPGPFGVEQTAELFEACDVVMLPYRESSGSGVLCMALTFDRGVICTAVGGMGEYLGAARNARLLERDDPSAIAAAIREAVTSSEGCRPPGVPMHALHWDVISRRLLLELRTCRRD